MIEIFGPTTAAARGGCMECDPTDDRGGDDEIYVLPLGGFTIRLCRHHVMVLQVQLGRLTFRKT